MQNLLDLLAAKGHHTACFIRTSADIHAMPFGRVRAFFSGIFSLRSRSAFRQFLKETRPDVVHVHNVFPLISPSVLLECHSVSVPVVMSVHNYRLVCPNGLHMSKRDLRLCDKCCGGHEYWCFLKNCEGSALKSLGYALRSYVARKARLYRANVSVYVCLTEFQRGRLVSEGYPPDRMAVIPNMVPPVDDVGDGGVGDYVGFAGRVSPEKGVDVFVAAAKKCPDIKFVVAGNYDRMPGILQSSPRNCTFLGHLCSGDLARFYASSRMIVVPSVWYEAFGLCAVEAQMHGKAVICSRRGALPDIVAEGAAGMLFDAGDADDLAEKVRHLWDHPDLCRAIGEAGRRRALYEYSPRTYYQRLMGVYEKAVALGLPG